MGFFQSLKDDLSEAVNGLIPEEEQNKGDIEIRDISFDENDMETDALEEADVPEIAVQKEGRKAERPAAVTRASNRAAARQMNIDNLPDIDLNLMPDKLDADDTGGEAAEQTDSVSYTETEEEAQAESVSEELRVMEVPGGDVLRPESVFEEKIPEEPAHTGNIILSMAPAEEETAEDIAAEEISAEIPDSPEEEAAPAEKTGSAAAEVQPQLSSTAARARETAKLRREERKKMDVKSRTTSDETALITVGMSVRGDIESDGSMDVYGSVTGNISISGKLNVSGIITGNSSAKEVYADGAEINGDVKCEGSVKVGQSTVIIGNVAASSAVIAGAVKGDIDVHGPVILDSSAIVMGNIRSQSVQISNGAVVEGMCSQVYAAVNPSSFFEEFKKSAHQSAPGK